MPVRGTGSDADGAKWVASVRLIPNIDADRAKARATLMYRVTPRLQVGVEINPRADEIGPLANWIAVTESGNRPALILGTSSDRIGTDDGQVYYGTLSKNLEPWLGINVSPYAGAGWSDRTNRWQELFGVNYRVLDGRFAINHIWDGVNLHHTATTRVRGVSVGLIVAEQDSHYSVGVMLGTEF